MRTIDRTRALLYDSAIVPLTTGWYRAVLTRLPVQADAAQSGMPGKAAKPRRRIAGGAV